MPEGVAGVDPPPLLLLDWIGFWQLKRKARARLAAHRARRRNERDRCFMLKIIITPADKKKFPLNTQNITHSWGKFNLLDENMGGS
jgi:hypothetical protein